MRVGRIPMVLWLVASAARCALAAATDPLAEVDPFIGTSFVGNCYPGAALPFAMVQPGPDSRKGDGGWHHCSGYRHDDAIISGFSQAHLNGTGISGMMDVLLQPFTGDGDGERFYGYKDFASETATPGYYAVSLTNFGVRAEVTAAQRVAYHRWTFAPNAAPRVYLDIMWPANNPSGWFAPTIGEMSSRLESCSHVLADDHREVYGTYHIMGWMSRDLSFVVRFSRPYRTVTSLPLRRGEKAPRYVFDFEATNEPLEAQVAISGVDLEGARGNLSAEGGRRFEDVRQAAAAKWREVLSRVEAEGLSPRERRIFRTALYHLCLQPNDIADADGRYRYSGIVARSRNPDGSHYSGFSLWDTFRAAHPLYTILFPEKVDCFCESILAGARLTGILPVLTFFGFDTTCMVGNHSVPVLVDAYLKGFRGFDAAEAFAAIDRTLTADHPDHPKSAFRLLAQYGYLPFDVLAADKTPTPFRAGGQRESVSRVMEGAYDDAAAARMAVALGKEERARFFLDRSRGWTNVFDSATGFVRGKDSKGRWREPFDPLLGGYATDYTEASAWVYTWHVMQEPDLLVRLLGGTASALNKLDGLFTAPEGPAYFDGTGRIGQYAHGNEPSHHIAYFYALMGRPERTAEIVRKVFDELYDDTPGGICGNDDCGQMDAWYLFSAAGFYPFDPCGGDYVLGAPQFPKTVWRLKDGKTFTITAKNLSKANKYVKSVTLNGRPLAGRILRHAEVVKGGELVFVMTNRPQ